MNIAIDKKIPIPTDGRTGMMKYPWERMEVGDSFFVPGRPRCGLAVPKSVAGRKFTRRKTDGGMRVWRIA